MIRAWGGLSGLALLGSVGLASAADWTVDQAKSTLGFTAMQAGQPFRGRFKTWTAAIAYDPAKPEAAHVSVTIDVASATTDDAQKDAAMPEADWFAASQYAKATFEANGFVGKGGDAFETQGTLTLRGVSKPVVLPFGLVVTGNQAHMTGSAKLLRTDFGVGQGQWTSGDMVGLDVSVDIDLNATSH